MIENRIYNDGERKKIVIISHGASESQVIYDSDGELTDWSTPREKYKLIQEPIENLEKEILES